MILTILNSTGNGGLEMFAWNLNVALGGTLVQLQACNPGSHWGCNGADIKRLCRKGVVAHFHVLATKHIIWAKIKGATVVYTQHSFIREEDTWGRMKRFLLLPFIDAYVAPSNVVRDQLTKLCYIPKSKTRIIYNAITIQNRIRGAAASK